MERTDRTKAVVSEISVPGVPGEGRVRGPDPGRVGVPGGDLLTQ